MNKITKSTPIVYAGDHKKSFSWIVALLAALGTYFVVWDRIGWVTIPAYAQDHTGASVEEQQKTIITSLDALTKSLGMLQKGQDDNQDQWECDETDEELQDLTNKEDAVGLTSKEKRSKKKLDEVWKTLTCSRFTD